MENILSIVKELQADSSKLGKEAILKRESNNVEFKQFIKYVLDPMYVYGIQNKKLKKYLGKTDKATDFEDIFQVFEYLLKNNTGRDEDARLVASFIDKFSEDSNELTDFYVLSITKKLRMGIDSTVNKAWGKGFLNKFEVMLAKDFYKESHKVEGKEFVLTEKLDGQRSLFFHKDGQVKVFSRSGQPIAGLLEIESEIKLLPEGVYDGELLIKNEHLYKNRDVLQETLKITRRDGEKTGVNFWMFDALSNDEFQEGITRDKYQDRRIWLENTIAPHLEHTKLLPILYAGKDMSVIPDLLAELEAEGKEGLMLNLDAPYQCKRTDSLLKIKSMKTFDENCTGVFEGEGKYKGMLGGVTVDYKGYHLKIGSGFSDEQRKLYWDSSELIVGKLIEVQYFRESSNAEGGLSVSFPVFKMIRDDKTVPSYY
ncbi:ATP-dependent DNA ligase [Lederbergia citrisecunda]|uniref:ATP-dependent DNA ligase n=1 Tax=Lederbergia citrisecunda TaxID=2833583 RepID=UPI003D2CDC7E